MEVQSGLPGWFHAGSRCCQQLWISYWRVDVALGWVFEAEAGADSVWEEHWLRGCGWRLCALWDQVLRQFSRCLPRDGSKVRGQPVQVRWHRECRQSVCRKPL